MVEIDAVKPRQFCGMGMIADDHGNRATELVIMMSMKQVGEAVQLLRHEDRHPCWRVRQFEAPTHLELDGKRIETLSKSRQVEIIEPPLHPHEEQASFVILMLIGVHDVGAAFVQERRDAGDEALSVGAVDEEGRGGHQEMLNAER